MSKITIIEGNSNDKDNVRVIMVKGEKGDTGDVNIEQLNAEATARTNADNILQSNIDNEATSRTNADTNLQENINSEAISRASADNNLQSQISSLASGSPLVANNTSEMTDTTKVYVNTSDGYWYYYNGSTWASGGTYQSTGLGDYTFFSQNLENNIINRVGENVDYQEITTYNNYIGQYMKNNGTLGGSRHFSCLVLDVKENDKIKINDTIDTSVSEYSYILLLNDTVISTNDKMNQQASNTYEKILTIPSGVNKIGINYKNQYSCNVKFYNVINSINLQNDNNKILDVIAPLNPYNPIEEGNSYIDVDKNNKTITIVSNSNFQYKKYDISQINDIILKYKNDSSKTVYAVIITDIDGNVLLIDNYQGKLPNTDITQKIYKPTNSKYLYIQNPAGQLLNIYNRNYLNTDEIKNDDTIKYDKFAIKNLERRCTNLENKNPFEWDNFDKTYFVFVIDDCNAFFPKAKEIFETNNAPLSSATLISKLNNVYTTYTPSNTKTVKELLDEMVANGGEVLSHYTGNLAPAGTPDTQSTHYLTTDEDWLERTRDVKMTLEELGYNVRGIITADSTRTGTSTGQKYCSLYFDYSDTLGTSPNFYLGRRKFFLSNDMQTMAQAKAYIDECCLTPGFYPFCFHGTRQDEPLVNENDLTEIINYIQNKGSSIAEITTYSNVFDEFGTTNLEKRLSVLENS